MMIENFTYYTMNLTYL